MGRAEDLWERLKSERIPAIEDLVVEQTVEELFLDFKQSSDSGSGTKLSADDRNNFAKAISGFGNSEGGIVVWGVAAGPDAYGVDAANALKPVENAKRYEGRLQSAVSGCTIPPHTGVQNYSIAMPGSQHGFVVSYIT